MHPVSNPLTDAVTGLAAYLRLHVPGAGIVYDVPTSAWPATEHARVMLGQPYVNVRPETGRARIEAHAEIMARVPDIVPEVAERTVEQILWEIAAMWHLPDSGTLGGAVAYALPGGFGVDYDDTTDDYQEWIVVTHTIVLGLTLPDNAPQL